MLVVNEVHSMRSHFETYDPEDEDEQEYEDKDEVSHSESRSTNYREVHILCS
jgi:hypothetical protein